MMKSKPYNYTQIPGRAADARALGAVSSYRFPMRRSNRGQSLGSLGGNVLDTPTLSMPLPAPGAPEPLSGCGCSGSCGCGPASPVGDAAATTPSTSSTPSGLVIAAGLALAWFLFKK